MATKKATSRKPKSALLLCFSFFQARLPSPNYGKGGLIWASFTLALLTLPVVIVATEEALAAVPSSMREGSYACGASKWQTIRRIVLPRALPGVMRLCRCPKNISLHATTKPPFSTDARSTSPRATCACSR